LPLRLPLPLIPPNAHLPNRRLGSCGCCGVELITLLLIRLLLFLSPLALRRLALQLIVGADILRPLVGAPRVVIDARYLVKFIGPRRSSRHLDMVATVSSAPRRRGSSGAPWTPNGCSWD
jgi:hypothetical protein